MATRSKDRQGQSNDRRDPAHASRFRRSRLPTYLGGKRPLASVLLLAGVLLIAPIAATLPGEPAGIWLPSAKLSAEDPVTEDDLGRVVDADGDRIVAGAPGAQAAYVFEKAGSDWVQRAELSRDVAGFGGAVAIDGSTLAVGAPDADQVYVFELVDGSWSETRMVFGEGGFGAAVGLHGGTLAVGAPDERSVHLFERGSQGWMPADQLVSGASGFGGEVALDQGVLAVGAPEAAGGGAVLVYERELAGWGLVADLQAESMETRWLGVSVDVDAASGLIVAGDLGTETAHVFQRSADAWAWMDVLERPELPEPRGRFGTSVAVADGTVAVGVPWEQREPGVEFSALEMCDRIGPYGLVKTCSTTGAVYTFDRVETAYAWALTSRLAPPDGLDGDAFGWSVGMAEGVLVAGAPSRSLFPVSAFTQELAGVVLDHGSAYVFETADEGWLP